jgi:hypothetical protein
MDSKVEAQQSLKTTKKSGDGGASQETSTDTINLEQNIFKVF